MNTIETAEIIQTALDEQMQTGSTSFRMEKNAGLVKYDGGSDVKIPKITMDGLGNYDGEYPEGNVTLEFETRTLSQDRARQFVLDKREVDESNFIATASNVMGQFQRTKVIPEMDAYRYYKIFKRANGELKTGAYVVDSTTILEKITSAINDIQDVAGEDEPLTIYLSKAAAQALDNSKDIEKSITVSDFKNGNVNIKVKELNGIPLQKVPGLRFKTDYTFGDNGFVAGEYAMDINFIVVADRALIAINKFDDMRIFDPDTWQGSKGWAMQYRRFHDVFIPDNKFEGVFVSYTPVDAAALSVVIAVGSVSGTTKATATAAAGNTLGYLLSDATNGIKYNDLYGGSAYTSGSDIAATAGQFLAVVEVDANSRVVGVNETELESGDIKA